MPAITSGKVLVTGANGFLAIFILQKLLAGGYSVRGTVRSESKKPYLQKLFASYGDKLELVVVDDITKDGAFDEAVKGVDAIQHTASPFHVKSKTPDDVIVPAVQGTLTILNSAAKHGDTVKRVVITSSFAAVEEFYDEVRTYTEDDWNEQGPRRVQEEGNDCPPGVMYAASKSLAEKAAWKWAEEHKGQVAFDLVTILPPYIYGPVLQDVQTTDHLNTSMDLIYQKIILGNIDEDALVNQGANWVDGRDVASAHIRSMEVEEIGGQRVMNSAGAYRWQDWVNAFREVDPSLPKGVESYDASKIVYRNAAANRDRSEKILGIKYHTMVETARDILDNFKEKGFYPAKAQ